MSTTITNATDPTPPQGRAVKDTMVVMHKLVQPNYIDVFTNTLSIGEILKWMDAATCLSAEKHSGHPSVTVSADDIHFEYGVKVGDLVVVKAMINKTYNKSMEVGCTVTAQDLRARTPPMHVCSAYFTFVSKNSAGKIVVLPAVIPQTEEEKKRYDLAEERKDIRMARKKQKAATETNATQSSGVKDDTLPTTRSRPRLSCENITTSSSYGNLIGSFPLVSDTPSSISLVTEAATRLRDYVMKPPSIPENSEELPTVTMSNTQVQTVEIVLPSHTQHHGTTFGGQIMDWLVNCAMIS
eukprot:Ihof_evm1s585 gene=Ihof_evmTU1s585